MHPMIRLAVVAAALLGLTATATAKDRLSVGLGFGYKIDANRLGETISTDGLDAGAPQLVALPPLPNDLGELALVDQSVIVPENTLIVFEDQGSISDLETNGAMIAFDIALNLQYNFLDVLFARVGFNYNTKVSGGKTSWKSELGDHLQEWGYSAWVIPVTIGVNVPIQEGKYNVYAGVGVAYGSGGFDITLKAPAGAFSNAANAGDVVEGADAFGTSGEVDEEASVRDSAIGLTYLVGLDGEFAENLGMFMEAETQYVAAMEKTVSFSDDDSAAVFGSDRLAYPAIPGGFIVRLGVKYTFFTMD